MGKSVPFEFVLEMIDSLQPTVRPMFGCTAVYVGSQMIFILRQKNNHLEDNGVWLATDHEHHTSLRCDFPFMRSIHLLGTRTTAWQNLPEDAPDFEESVVRACDLVVLGDPRIGKTPKPKPKRKAAPSKIKPAKKPPRKTHK